MLGVKIKIFRDSMQLEFQRFDSVEKKLKKPCKENFYFTKYKKSKAFTARQHVRWKYKKIE